MGNNIGGVNCDFNNVNIEGYICDNYRNFIKKILLQLESQNLQKASLMREIEIIENAHNNMRLINDGWINDILNTFIPHSLDGTITITIIEWLEKNHEKLDKNTGDAILRLCLTYLEKRKNIETNIVKQFFDMIKKCNVSIIGEINWQKIENDLDTSTKYIKNNFQILSD